MSGYFKDLFGGTKSLVVGLGITFRYMCKPVVTLQYPHESLKMSQRFRGHIELIGDEETGAPKCIVCGMCQKACPSNCIKLAGEKPEGAKKKALTNHRASGRDNAAGLDVPRTLTLDAALEWIAPDELVEVTPKSVRVRKAILDAEDRKREMKRTAIP